ncbi:hypothetical protein [Rudaea sp.]|uniref:hypothetical protein n=1 Tax=Rudaea sp. TaxID=2136325 RepID=UPI003782F385
MGFVSADDDRHSQHTPADHGEQESRVSARSLPAPLVPAHADLRKLEYMPLLGGRLFSSDFQLRASDFEFRVAVTLWWAAWNQVPAGSLPSDYASLAQLAYLGGTARAVSRYMRCHARATHGFILCSDGRLYHKVLCEQVLIALEKRAKDLDRKAKWRARRRGQDGDNSRGDRDRTGTQFDGHGSVPSDGTVRDGTKELKEHITNQAHALPTVVPGEVGQAERACALMQRAGCKAVNASHPNLLAALDEGISPEALEATAREGAAKQGIENLFAWAIQTARSRRTGATSGAVAPPQAPQRKFWRPERRMTDEQRSESLAKGLGSVLSMLGIGGQK